MNLNGKLKNGNPSGNPNSAPRCNAYSRRTGNTCKSPAIKGKTKCRMHGGRSTGVNTAEGIKRIKEANLIHGKYTKEAIQDRKKKEISRLVLKYRLKMAISMCRKLYKKKRS